MVNPYCWWTCVWHWKANIDYICWRQKSDKRKYNYTKVEKVRQDHLKSNNWINSMGIPSREPLYSPGRHIYRSKSRNCNLSDMDWFHWNHSMRLKSGLISYGPYDMDHILNVFMNVNHEFGMFLGINAT